MTGAALPVSALHPSAPPSVEKPVSVWRSPPGEPWQQVALFREALIGQVEKRKTLIGQVEKRKISDWPRKRKGNAKSFATHMYISVSGSSDWARKQVSAQIGQAKQ